MARYTYTRPHRLEQLHDELVAAGLAVTTVEGDETTVWVSVPDTVPEPAVATVIAAHDPESDTRREALAERTNEQIRQAVRTAAQGAAGKRLADLTTAERNALIAVLLWREGALSPTLTIRDLALWAQ